MDVMYSQITTQDNAPLNKRRRFAPDPSLCVMPHNENQASDSPLLWQLNGQTPTPEDIERELLQVGMRVRKSVNDGYKTNAFTPRPFFNMARLSPATQAALCSGTLNRQPLNTSTFCGINLAALAHVSTTPVEEQKMWSYSTSHKRGYEGDSDSDDLEFMPQTPILGEGESFMGMPIEYFNIDFDGSEHMSQSAPQVPGRRIAKLRSRRQPQATSQDANSNPFGQLAASQQPTGFQWMGHRRVTSCGIEANLPLNGFAEASFLQRREDVDMDCS